ncbi:unnamed protein product [Amoebophrya sp. A25]|nr:unnamed protein product [Amoebophrya sp. A25]|eukprot:GSA25T00022423001.1
MSQELHSQSKQQGADMAAFMCAPTDELSEDNNKQTKTSALHAEEFVVDSTSRTASPSATTEDIPSQGMKMNDLDQRQETAMASTSRHSKRQSTLRTSAYGWAERRKAAERKNTEMRLSATPNMNADPPVSRTSNPSNINTMNNNNDNFVQRGSGGSTRVAEGKDILRKRRSTHRVTVSDNVETKLVLLESAVADLSSADEKERRTTELTTPDAPDREFTVQQLKSLRGALQELLELRQHPELPWWRESRPSFSEENLSYTDLAERLSSYLAEVPEDAQSPSDFAIAEEKITFLLTTEELQLVVRALAELNQITTAILRSSTVRNTSMARNTAGTASSDVGRITTTVVDHTTTRASLHPSTSSSSSGVNSTPIAKAASTSRASSAFPRVSAGAEGPASRLSASFLSKAAAARKSTEVVADLLGVVNDVLDRPRPSGPREKSQRGSSRPSAGNARSSGKDQAQQHETESGRTSTTSTTTSKIKVSRGPPPPPPPFPPSFAEVSDEPDVAPTSSPPVVLMFPEPSDEAEVATGIEIMKEQTKKTSSKGRRNKHTTTRSSSKKVKEEKKATTVVPPLDLDRLNNDERRWPLRRNSRNPTSTLHKKENSDVDFLFQQSSGPGAPQSSKSSVETTSSSMDSSSGGKNSSRTARDDEQEHHESGTADATATFLYGDNIGADGREDGSGAVMLNRVPLFVEDPRREGRMRLNPYAATGAELRHRKKNFRPQPRQMRSTTITRTSTEVFVFGPGSTTTTSSSSSGAAEDMTNSKRKTTSVLEGAPFSFQTRRSAVLGQDIPVLVPATTSAHTIQQQVEERISSSTTKRRNMMTTTRVGVEDHIADIMSLSSQLNKKTRTERMKAPSVGSQVYSPTRYKNFYLHTRDSPQKTDALAPPPRRKFGSRGPFLG